MAVVSERIDRISARVVAKRDPPVGRTRLRVTRAFAWYFGVVLALAFAALSFGSNPAWAMVFLLAGMLVAGTMQAWRRMAGLTFSHGTPLPVPVTRPASLPLQVANPGHRPAFGVLVMPAKESPDDHLWLAAYVAARGDASGDLLLPSMPRGVHPLPELLVAVRWPLGLVQAERRWKPLGEIVVHPEPRGKSLEESLPQSRPLGEPSDGRGRDGDDFDGLRAYRPGDSPRHIHWKAAARTDGDPPVKIFAGSAAGELVLSWEDCAGGTEVRLSQLTRWVEDAAAGGLRFGLNLPGSELPPDSGEAHRLACLRLLARWNPPMQRAGSTSKKTKSGIFKTAFGSGDLGEKSGSGKKASTGAAGSGANRAGRKSQRSQE